MSDIKITRENVYDYPIGTKVIGSFGAYYPIVEGLVVDYHATPASKHFDELIELVIDFEDGTEDRVSRLVDSGIGIYLEDVYIWGKKTHEKD